MFALALLVPSLVFLTGSYVEPAVWTVRTSFQRLDGLHGVTLQPAGSANYRQLLDQGYGQAIGFALSLTWIPLLAALIVAPLLAWCAHRAGVPGRWFAGASLVACAAAFTPVAFAAAARTDRYARLDETGGEVGALRLGYGLATFALVTAFATTLYLAALRRRDADRRPWLALGGAGVLVMLAVVAAALQEFTYPLIITGGGPRGETTTPLLMMFTVGFQEYQFGPAAAASTLLLAALAVLGLGATVLIISTEMRLEVDASPYSADHSRRWDRERVTAVAVTKLFVVAVVLIALYVLWPWLGELGGGAPAPRGAGSASAIFARTWLPPLVSTVVGVLAAALGGYCIGALRPFGRRSELLLLPFAPFLFVGMGPLALRAYAAGETARRLDTTLGLIPPTRLAIPALFIFALLFRGLAVRARETRGSGARSWWLRYGRPALPMVGVVAAVTWFVQAQDVLWPLLSASARQATGPVLVATSSLGVNDGSPHVMPVWLALPGWLALVAVALAVAAQLGYLDRVALRVGASEPSSTKHRPGSPPYPALGRAGRSESSAASGAGRSESSTGVSGAGRPKPIRLGDRRGFWRRAWTTAGRSGVRVRAILGRPSGR